MDVLLFFFFFSSFISCTVWNYTHFTYRKIETQNFNELAQIHVIYSAFIVLSYPQSHLVLTISLKGEEEREEEEVGGGGRRSK